ncbi:hypothetical protein FG167_15740 [Lacinutrix sp. WUR7]|uniref:hypothetical protein n=1 Tax=Lacinutrix sp. WUR7 TaxID=2653681 RepID=UPI00193D9884|nr:hypothetical protein [Lacinutrix sp. WUR7]QRM90626.1 hypothetical protein FG167_15740 [Lacinutrix sp. WUR7]
MKNKKIINTVSATILALFALLTLFLSSSVIFDWFGIRAKEGNYVLFIVWTNFMSSILYLIAVFGFLKNKKWTFWALIVALGILIIAFIALLVYVNNGGIHEAKTIKAMVFRMLVTLSFSILAFLFINKQLK